MLYDNRCLSSGSDQVSSIHESESFPIHAKSEFFHLLLFEKKICDELEKVKFLYVVIYSELLLFKSWEEISCNLISNNNT